MLPPLLALHTGPLFAPQASASPLVRDATSRPLSTFMIALNVGIFAYQRLHSVQAAKFAVSYRTTVEDLESWRVVSASLSHLGVMHIAFNMASLYALGSLEGSLGALRYFAYSFDLIILPVALLLACAHGLYRGCGVERYRDAMSAGFSCVIFGLMVVDALATRRVCPVPFAPALCFATYELPLGGFGAGFHPTVAFNAAPFVMLVVTQVIVPKASFLGHLCGIAVGYPIAWGVLRWCTPPLVAKMCALAIARLLLATPTGAGAFTRRATELRAAADLAPLLVAASAALLVALVAPFALALTAAFSHLLSSLLAVVVARALARGADETRAARLLIALAVPAAIDACWLALELGAVVVARRALRRSAGDAALGAGIGALAVALGAALGTTLAALVLLRRFEAGREQLARWSALRWLDRVAVARLVGCAGSRVDAALRCLGAPLNRIAVAARSVAATDRTTTAGGAVGGGAAPRFVGGGRLGGEAESSTSGNEEREDGDSNGDAP